MVRGVAAPSRWDVSQGRQDAEAALQKAQQELAAQAGSMKELEQQLATAKGAPVAAVQAISPAG